MFGVKVDLGGEYMEQVKCSTLKFEKNNKLENMWIEL